MERKKGFTLIELIFGLAILAIMMSMIGPMLNTLNKTNQREEVVNKLDSNLGKAVELVKRTARAAKDAAGRRAIVVNSAGDTVTMNVPIEQPPINSGIIVQSIVVFKKNGTNLQIGSTTDGTIPTQFDTISENLDIIEFRYDRSVLTMYFRVNINKTGENYDWKRREVRDSAVTRINLEQ